MINEQVRNYFFDLKIKEMCELAETRYRELTQPIYVYLEAVGDNFRVHIDEEDLRWARYVRTQFLKRHPHETVPSAQRVVATKYALLHSMPLNTYNVKWSEERKMWEIYRSRRVGGGKKHEDTNLVLVNDSMRELYRSVHKIKAKLNPDKEQDKKIADWWAQDTENCIFAPVPQKKDQEPGIPHAFAKIVEKTAHSVTLAFRERNTSPWKAVDKIGININKFREKVRKEGFNEKRHADALLNYGNWDEILAPEKVGRGGKEANPFLTHDEKSFRKYKDDKDGKEYDTGYHVARPKTVSQIEVEKYKKDPEAYLKDPKNKAIAKKIANNPEELHKFLAGKMYIRPGKNTAEYDPSEAYTDLYNNDREFRRYMDKASIEATVSAVNQLSRANISMEYAPNGDHRVYIKGDDRTINDEDDVRDIRQDTLMKFQARTGQISDNDWRNWKKLLDVEDKSTGLGGKIYQLMVGSAKTAVSDFRTEASREQGAGGHDEEKISAIDGASDGRRAVAASVPDQASDNMSADDSPQMKIIKQLKDDDFLERSPKGIGDALRNWAQRDQVMADLLRKMNIDLDAVDARQKQLQGDDEDEDGFSKYRKPVAVPGMARHESNFQKFLSQRMSLDEMGVVWGNDKSSANKLKPGQTLKGGIQVFGAPWSAGGGPNKKGNDIKIK